MTLCGIMELEIYLSSKTLLFLLKLILGTKLVETPQDWKENTSNTLKHTCYIVEKIQRWDHKCLK